MKFESYDSKYLGTMLVNLQTVLDNLGNDDSAGCKYAREFIVAIASELLRRYRQDTEIMNRKYANA